MTAETLTELEKQFTQQLRSNGKHGSRQRSVVLRAFLRQEKPVTAQELLYPVKQEDISVSFGTVYHTLRLLVACGLAREIVSAKDSTKYERATAQCNHSHLVCKDCGAVVQNGAGDVGSEAAV
jgi:Fur family transcriptional regulator, ferric uptake regulator